MSKIIFLLMFIVTAIAYIALANLSVFGIDFIWNNINGMSKDGSTVSGKKDQVGFGDTVSIYAPKQRFYGKIVQQNSSTNIYLFNFIRLPLIYKRVSYFIIHIGAFFTIILVSLLVSKEYERRYG